MIRLYGLFFLIDMALLVIALIDCLSTDEYEIRNLPKVVWVFLILLFSPIGAIAWFVAGRPQRQSVRRGGAWRPGNGFPEATRPRQVAPDDDPQFLGRVDRARREDEEMFKRWEADLKRREDDLRRRTAEDGDPV